MSLKRGVAVFLYTIYVLRSPTSTTGHLSFVRLWVINTIGDAPLVLFSDNIPKDTNFAFPMHDGHIFFTNRNGMDKEGYLPITSMPMVILGHYPISSRRLKALLYLYIMIISVSFSGWDGFAYKRFNDPSNILSSFRFLWGSFDSSQG